MNDQNPNKYSATARHPAKRRLSPDNETRQREYKLAAHCANLEKQIIAPQNKLIDSHYARRRLQKQAGKKTEQRLSQNRQYHYDRDELLDFAKHAVGKLESERHKISRELHDNVAQGLAAIKLFLENKMALTGKEENSASFSIESILEITRDNLNEIRRLINYLRPKMIDDIGLLATIQWHWQEFQARSPALALKIKLAESEADIPERLKMIIYRVIQEASSNIERHSRATRVEFELQRKDQSLRLKICDNGKGFDREARPSEQRCNRNPGLTSMKEYTELSDGRFSLRTSPSNGTCIQATWDLGARQDF